MSQTTDTQTETWESNSQILVGNDCECYFQNTHYVTINNIAFMHMISMSDVIYFTLKIDLLLPWSPLCGIPSKSHSSFEWHCDVNKTGPFNVRCQNTHTFCHKVWECPVKHRQEEASSSGGPYAQQVLQRLSTQSRLILKPHFTSENDALIKVLQMLLLTAAKQ